MLVPSAIGFEVGEKVDELGDDFVPIDRGRVLHPLIAGKLNFRLKVGAVRCQELLKHESEEALLIVLDAVFVKGIDLVALLLHFCEKGADVVAGAEESEGFEILHFLPMVDDQLRLHHFYLHLHKDEATYYFSSRDLIFVEADLDGCHEAVIA